MYMIDSIYNKGTELIMAFDGWELKANSTFSPDHNTQMKGRNKYYQWERGNEVCNMVNLDPHCVNYLYNMTLMFNVIEKINKLGIDDFGEPNFCIHANKAFIMYNDHNEYFVNYVTTKIHLNEAIWLTVVEFLAKHFPLPQYIINIKKEIDTYNSNKGFSIPS